jgi:hypothetical protein
MRIDSSGNVGIGTTASVQKLTVWGAGTLPSTIANTQLLVGDTSGFANAGIALVTNAGNGSRLSFGSTASPLLGSLSYDNTNNSMSLSTNSTERMRIDSNGIVTGTAGNLMLISGTSQATTSGTFIDFTGIPSWVKRITVMTSAVSTNGTSGLMIQLGTSGGFVTTGYLCTSDAFNTAPSSVAFTNGFAIGDTVVAAGTSNAVSVIIRISGNSWVFSSVGSQSAPVSITIGGGSITLGSEITQLRYTTAGGVNTFDAGSVNILYE